MDSSLLEYIDYIQCIFDEALGPLLLYRLERPQYRKLLEENPNMKCSTVYGAEHLLRLFIKLPSFLSSCGIGEEPIEKTKIVATKLLEYMEKNQTSIFLGDYEAASEDILRESGLYSG